MHSYYEITGLIPDQRYLFLDSEDQRMDHKNEHDGQTDPRQRDGNDAGEDEPGSNQQIDLIPYKENERPTSPRCSARSDSALSFDKTIRQLRDFSGDSDQRSPYPTPDACIVEQFDRCDGGAPL